jgi:hypothetical protein
MRNKKVKEGTIMTVLRSLLYLVCAIATSQVRARSGDDGFQVGVNVSYETQKMEQGGSTATESKEMNSDVKLGYQMPSGLYLGLIYVNDATESSQKTSLNGYGPSVGYSSDVWFIHAHSILSSEFDPIVGDSSKYTKGSGLQIDLGYLFPFGASFRMGFELSHRTLEFKALTTSSVDDTTFNLIQNELRPKICLAWMF